MQCKDNVSRCGLGKLLARPFTINSFHFTPAAGQYQVTVSTKCNIEEMAVRFGMGFLDILKFINLILVSSRLAPHCSLFSVGKKAAVLAVCHPLSSPLIMVIIS
jgi:hypothetical protein